MATAAGKTANEARANSDLEADIRQLKADIDKLTKQLAKTGEHGYGTAAARPPRESSNCARRVKLRLTAFAAVPRISRRSCWQMFAKSR